MKYDMTSGTLEANMRDAGLYLLLFFSTMAGVLLALFFLKWLFPVISTSQPDLLPDAALFATSLGGFFLFMWKESILTFRVSRRVRRIMLLGLVFGGVTTATHAAFGVLFQTQTASIPALLTACLGTYPIASQTT
jgi:hypothetical protein